MPRPGSRYPPASRATLGPSRRGWKAARNWRGSSAGRWGRARREALTAAEGISEGTVLPGGLPIAFRLEAMGPPKRAYKRLHPSRGAPLHFTMDGLSEFIASLMVSSSLMIAVLAATVRFAVRPLLADWAKLKNPGNGVGLERRLAAMEEDIRQLQAGGDK